MVVDGGVHVVKADAGLRPAGSFPAEGLVAAAVGDPAELLDVDVHQVAERGVRSGGSPGPWADPSTPGGAGRAGPGSGARSRRASPGSGRCGPGRACARPGAGTPPLPPRLRSGAVSCAVVRSGRAGRVRQWVRRRRTHWCGRTRDAHLGGDVRNRTADATRSTRIRRPNTVSRAFTVGHEDLRWGSPRQLHHIGGLRHDQDQTSVDTARDQYD